MFSIDGPILPDVRFVDRLEGLVRKTSSPRAFASAGRALAAVVATRGDGTGPRWAQKLAEAMLSSLWLVQARTVDEADAGFRVELAAAAAALAVLRPEKKAACMGAVRVWMGIGMSDPNEMTDVVRLAERALLALLVDDVAQAERSVVQLGVIELGGAGGVLHDWAIARRQRHGAMREAECLHHLRLALSDEPPRSRATVLLLGAIVAHERAGAAGTFAAWLDEVDPFEKTDPGIRQAV